MFYTKGAKRSGSARKATAILLSCLIMIWPAFGAFAAADATVAEDEALAEAFDDADVKPIDIVLEGGIMAIGAEIGPDDFGGQGEAAFSVLSGTVSLIIIEMPDAYSNQPVIRIRNEEGGETDFIIDDAKTVVSDLSGFASFSSINEGDNVDVYFLKPLIITMQYPPRYMASVVVIRSADNPGSAFVGVVDKDGRASDGSIVLNISGDTDITRQSDGKKADKASIASKNIIAYFAITTRSMPPQALVTKVVVLDKLGLPVFVNGARVYEYGAEAIVNADGVILAPLRAVVEAMGYDVTWDDAERAARVGVAIYVKIGSDEYTVGRAMPLKLDAAAELIYSRTYVPLSFFTSILQMELDENGGLINFTGKAVE